MRVYAEDLGYEDTNGGWLIFSGKAWGRAVQGRKIFNDGWACTPTYGVRL